MPPYPLRHLHFIGICGTAMATLAAMCREAGHRVTGSDQHTYPPMSTFLAEKGIEISSPFSKENLIPQPDLVVVGNAISRGNVEAEAVLNERMTYTSSADLLREAFIRGRHSVVVSGTHGKTTTTSLAAWILTYAGLDPTVMIGGIARNFQSSYRMGAGELFVCEGDEYDTAFFDKTPKFLHYLPSSVIVNNIEFDHADIYPSLEAIELQFRRLVNLIPQNGLLLAGGESPAVLTAVQKAFCKVQTFGVGDFYWSASNLEPWSAGDDRGADVSGVAFDVSREGRKVARVTAPLSGSHNVRNVLAAFGLAVNLGVSPEAAAEAVRQFAGVKRRLELLGHFGQVNLYDDFAHHPTAVRETLAGIRATHPGVPLVVAFEPRSATSRRRIFQEDFALSLALADTILLSYPYEPSRIPEGERLDPFALTEHLRQLGRKADLFQSADEIVQWVDRHLSPPAMLIIMSNGGFGGIHGKLSDLLERRFGMPDGGADGLENRIVRSSRGGA